MAEQFDMMLRFIEAELATFRALGTVVDPNAYLHALVADVAAIDAGTIVFTEVVTVSRVPVP